MTSVSAQEARLATGALVGERFEIEGVLGEDPTGVVYRAKDRATSRPAFVKVMLRKLLQSREYASRFRRECAAATRVRHPAAARVLATGATEDHLPFVAMEAVAGRSLAEVIAKEGALPVRRAAAIARSVLGALAAAHRVGVVHRGLEPSLIRVEAGADGAERVKVLDLGVPRVVTGEVGDLTGAIRTRGGVVLGTVKYMAPELLRGETADGRADVYSAGAVLYEMLGGKPPFEAQDLPAFLATKLNEPAESLVKRAPKAGVPADLDRLVLTMLEKDSDARPADAAALADALGPFAGADPAARESDVGSMRGVAAAVVGGVIGGAAAVFLCGPRGAQTASIAASAAAAAVGLGAGAGIGARLAPGTSIADFVTRVAVVTGTVVACALASLPMSKAPGFFALGVAASCALVALLSYAGLLLVRGTKAHGLRPLLAGIVAPALALAIAPVFVAPAKHDPYFVAALGASRTDSERDARTQFLLAAACISLSFGLASTLLPRPREAAE